MKLAGDIAPIANRQARSDFFIFLKNQRSFISSLTFLVSDHQSFKTWNLAALSKIHKTWSKNVIAPT
jgi:hypothetical protein